MKHQGQNSGDLRAAARHSLVLVQDKHGSNGLQQACPTSLFDSLASPDCVSGLCELRPFAARSELLRDAPAVQVAIDQGRSRSNRESLGVLVSIL